MTTHDKDKIIAAAKECGYWSGQTIEMNDVGIERFYAIAFEAGRQAEREECAVLCDRVQFTGYVPPEDGNAADYYDAGAEECADRIRERSTL